MLAVTGLALLSGVAAEWYVIVFLAAVTHSLLVDWGTPHDSAVVVAVAGAPAIDLRSRSVSEYLHRFSSRHQYKRSQFCQLSVSASADRPNSYRGISVELGENSLPHSARLASTSIRNPRRHVWCVFGRIDFLCSISSRKILVAFALFPFSCDFLLDFVYYHHCHNPRSKRARRHLCRATLDTFQTQPFPSGVLRVYCRYKQIKEIP